MHAEEVRTIVAIEWVTIAHELDLKDLTTKCEEIILRNPQFTASLSAQILTRVPPVLLARLLKKAFMISSNYTPAIAHDVWPDLSAQAQ